MIQVRIAAVLLCLLSAVAAAQDGESPAAALRRAYDADGTPGAVAYLQHVKDGYEGGGGAGRMVDAAEAALEVLPTLTGNRHATEMVLTVLQREYGQARAWGAAMALRSRLLNSLDVEGGVPFLNAMSDSYPDQSQFFLIDLGYLQERSGHPVEARAAFERVLTTDAEASVITALYRLAALDELDGDVDSALRRYDEIHAKNASPWPLIWQTRVLRGTARRYDDAEASLSRARTATEALAAGPKRDELRRLLDDEVVALTESRSTQHDLREISGHIDRALLGALAAWLLLLGGGGLLLRRKGVL